MFKRTEVLQFKWEDGAGDGCKNMSSSIDDLKECKKSFLAKIWSWLVD